jgi:hypothetical protein
MSEKFTDELDREDMERLIKRFYDEKGDGERVTEFDWKIKDGELVGVTLDVEEMDLDSLEDDEAGGGRGIKEPASYVTPRRNVSPSFRLTDTCILSASDVPMSMRKEADGLSLVTLQVFNVEAKEHNGRILDARQVAALNEAEAHERMSRCFRKEWGDKLASVRIVSVFTTIQLREDYYRLLVDEFEERLSR